MNGNSNFQYLTHANIFFTVGSSRKDSAYEVPSPSLVDQLSLSSTEDIPPPDYEVTPPLPQQVTIPLSRVVNHCLSSSQCTALVSRQCQAEESFFPWGERELVARARKGTDNNCGHEFWVNKGAQTLPTNTSNGNKHSHAHVHIQEPFVHTCKIMKPTRVLGIDYLPYC